VAVNFNRVQIGDCREVLRAIPDAMFHSCVTSPPYWGLRDYGTATWEGGDAACDHFKLAGGTGAQNLGKSPAASAANVERSSVPYRDACGKCGARRIDAQLGLEDTPEAYVENMVAVFREVRRVLRDDGAMWLNLGDSYIGGHMNGRSGPNGITGPGTASTVLPHRNAIGLKPKDLVGIPWRVAFALQADGWYLRSDIIWHKPNPMPESVTDRPTKAHEYVFLLSKSERYWYDAKAIAEPASGRASGRIAPDKTGEGPGFQVRAGFVACGDVEWNERNARTVWTIATEPYSGSHFATFPQALVTRCVLAGLPTRGRGARPVLR